jgi:hypothetical protein
MSFADGDEFYFDRAAINFSGGVTDAAADFR